MLSDTKRQTFYDSIYTETPRKVKSQRQKVGKTLPGAEERGIGELLFNRHRVSVWDEEKLLEIELMAVQCCEFNLLSLNCTLKIMAMINFMCILPQF